MFEIHTTTDGNSMFVAQMSDSHLLNTIKLWLRQFVSARSAIEAASKPQDPIMRVLAKVKPEDILKRAEKELENAHRSLQPYICEAALRGLPQLTEILQVAYGRKNALLTPQYEDIEELMSDEVTKGVELLEQWGNCPTENYE